MSEVAVFSDAAFSNSWGFTARSGVSGSVLASGSGLPALVSLAQGELHPLEVGLHALRSGLSVREYADRLGHKHHMNVATRRNAAEVADHCKDILTPDAHLRWSQLAEIHAAPRWLWHALAAVVFVRALLDVLR